jgi:hypothetical protein
MYFQTANEEIATSIISEHLESVLNGKLLKDLSHQIWKQVTGRFGNRKEPLIKEVLTHLANHCGFNDFIRYIHHPKYHVERWIEHYISDVFDRKKGEHTTEIQECIKTYLERSCDTIQDCAKNAGSESKAHEEPWEYWIGCFKDKLNSEAFYLPQDSFDTLSELTVENFENLFSNIERQLKACRYSILVRLKGLRVSQINFQEDDPVEKIMKSLWHCDHTCPWCHEPCVASSSEDKHFCKQHRPGGIAGTPWRDSGKLVVESCEFKVQSTTLKHCGNWCTCNPKTDEFHPYKRFKEFMKDDWNISGSADMSSSKYWTWVFRKFEKDFVRYYNARSPDFPALAAFNVEKEDAINSLSIYE